MPLRAATVCRKPGCPGLVRDGKCSSCGPLRTQTDKTHDKRRGTSTQRGYGGRWQRLRLMFLRANPLCVLCESQDFVTAATDVHHITAKRDGGADEWDNLEALCHSCHSKLTGAGG